MKKTLLYLAGAAALLAGCAKEIAVEDPTPVPGEKTITIQASIDPETRTTVEINGNKGVYSWVENERIAVFEANEVFATIEPFSVTDIQNGLFEGILSDGFSLAGAVTPRYLAEGGAFVNGKLFYDINLGGFYNYENGTNAVMVAGAPTASGDSYKFTFKHAAALVKITYENVPVGTTGFSITTDQPITGEFDFDSFENVELVCGSAVATTETTAYVEFSSAVTEPNQTFTFYAPIPTGDYNEFSVALVGSGYQPIEGTSKTKRLKTAFTVARGDIVALPTITLAPAPEEKFYVKVTSVDQIVDGAQYVIGATFNDGDAEAFYAIPAKPTVNSGKITGVVVPSTVNGIATSDAEDYVWTLSKSGNFYALSDGEGYLYHSNGGNSGTNIAYGTSASFLWSITMGDSERNRFKFAGVNAGTVKDRGLLFNGSVFGGYALTNFNSYAGIELFVLVDERQAIASPTNLQVSGMTLSWNAVEGAANYSVIVGNTKTTVETTSYTFEGEADYYDVSVIANPSDDENYKPSVPATLDNAQFGSPTLKTPVLAEGVVDETSITVTWVVDPHAETYTCEIYEGETKVDEDLVESGSVTFTDLENGKTYLIKVYADAVVSPLAYAQSGIATIEIATKAKKTISTVLENGAGTYVISDVSVLAVKNNAMILGDETGKVYTYKSSNTFKVGDVVTVSGEAKLYNGVFEFDSPEITKTGTATVNHGTATEISTAGSTLQAEFTSASNIHSAVYVHGIGEQTDNRKIVFGDVEVYLTANESATNGKQVEVYGYVYAYSTSNSNFNFLVTSIEEYVDPNAPDLSISPATTSSNPATWISGNGDAKTFTVTPTNGTWAYEASNMDWATITRSDDGTGNVLTVTPKNAQAAENYTGSITITLTPSYQGYSNMTETIYLSQAKYSSGGDTHEDIVINLDFSLADTYPEGFPTSSGTATGSYAFDGYTFGFKANTAFYFSENTNGNYLLIGKSGKTENTTSYIELPAPEGYKLTEISISASSGTSTNIKAYVGSAYSTKVTGDWQFVQNGTSNWTLSSVNAGTTYRIYLVGTGNNTYNGQITALHAKYVYGE